MKDSRFEETITEIESNAKRLLEDAIVLKNNKRHQSSCSIAILAIEEAGKACLLKWHHDGLLKQKLKLKEVLSHTTKQKIISTFLMIVSYNKALIELFEDESNIKIITSNVANENFDENPIVDLLKKIIDPRNNEIYESVLDKVTETSNLSICAEHGALDWIKQLGFYTDIDENFITVKLNKDFMLDESDAKYFIEVAKESISVIRKNKMHPIMASIYQNNKTLNRLNIVKTPGNKQSPD